MAELQTELLAACYTLARASAAACLREALLANMVGLSKASAGLMLGRADTGEFVRLGVLPAMVDVHLPDLAELEREQHPLAAVLAASAPLMEGSGGNLGAARAAMFDMPGRLLTIPACSGGGRIDLIFLLLLPPVAGPSTADIATLAAFADHGARLNHLFLRVQTETSVRKDLSRALDHADQDRSRVLNETLPGLLSGRLVGQTHAMQNLRRNIAKFGQSRLPVLVTGETGTGKELVARELHRISDRAQRPLIAVNVAALPAELLESELFGHVRGAFTGATGARKGLIAEAHQGTLFLDEIGDMPLPLQAKLLRVLQEKCFRPVGADKEVASDFRLICATHRDLAADVDAGRFRRDLFYRIVSVHLVIPPLRERFEDIGQLSAHFLTEIGQREDMAAKELSPAALAALKRQSFPGNVRELQSLIERAALLAGEVDLIDVTHLDMQAPGGASAAPSGLSRLLRAEGLAGARDRFERFLILDELTAAKGNRRQAAERLGMPTRTLNWKLHENANHDDFDSRAFARDLTATAPPASGERRFDLKAACDAFERVLILEAHELSGGDRRLMAEQLRLAPSTLAEKLRRNNLSTPDASRGQPI